MGIDSMKTLEDEAFDELAKKQGMWGGGFQAKRAAAADKLHWSDCAVHNEPAYPAGPCDCGVAQEPVAWMVYTQDGQSVYVTDNPTDIQKGQRALPLYTTPPKREWEEWNAALDEAASRINEITAFPKTTQDSFAVFIQGLKK